MAITNPQPPQIGGTTYPYMSVSLALSTSPNGPNMVLSMVVTLTPYRLTEQGVDMLEEGKKVLVWGDAVMAATSDPYLAYFLQAIEAAGQVYVSEAL
jgi:hypothetical protein